MVVAQYSNITYWLTKQKTYESDAGEEDDVLDGHRGGDLCARVVLRSETRGKCTGRERASAYIARRGAGAGAGAGGCRVR
jgi:hypothetical protein